MTTKKAFNELTEAGKKARLAKYAEQDAKFGLKEGLFRVTRITRHQDRHFENWPDAASFGFNVVPAGKSVDANDFKPNKFVWVNQLVNLDAGKPVIDAVEKMQAKLKDPNTKSLLVSMKYSVKEGNDGKQYINANSVYNREK